MMNEGRRFGGKQPLKKNVRQALVAQHGARTKVNVYVRLSPETSCIGRDTKDELERRLAKAIRCKNEQLASDLYVELGDEYRRLGDLQRAIDTYMNGMQLAHRIDAFENAAFAHRAIAEISVDPDINENKRALEHGRMYLEAANKTEQVHLIQLAYHVLGWLYLQVYLNSATKHTSLLEKGKRWCEKCVAYLEQKAAEIDCDQRAVRMGRDSACRRARVRQVLSQICDKLGMVQLARCHHGAVMAYASRTADFDLQYRCLLAKLDFTGEQRLKTAIELVHVASNLSSRELLEAQLILAQEKARVKDFEGAKWDLISMLSSKGFTKLEADEQKSFHQLLIVVYKTIERLKEVKELDEHQQSRVYEKIADEFYEVELQEVSLNFYKLMLDHAKSVRERVAASVSVAITAKELSRYEEAYEYFVRVEMLESELNISDLKCDLYEAMLEFLRKSNAEESLIKSTEDKMAKTKSAADEEREIGDGTIEDDFDSDARSSFADRWDEMTDIEIIQRCTVESSRRSVEERINREKDKRINSYGETRLHEAARGDDIVYLKALVAAGYNVNARDEGGWTPLHEAIGAQKLENLRLLLQAGAKTDIRSREGNISAEGQRTDSGGLTPLMEACDRGSTAMIDTLLEFGANVSLKNPDSWTAVDFLRNAITAGMVEEEDMSEAERLIHLMEDKLRKGLQSFLSF
ncbi:unnamed protein product [Toxocara canis]|uniref:Tonsoku-like protein n=1 Tax=Toxocara canis TaxID=6265 RepID=A0A183UJP9_TOXCA|nr:unnamed protein product [Toxocara canis]